MTAQLVHVVINRKKFHIPPCQTGAALKALVGACKEDVLFLQRRCEDEVIPDDAKVVLDDCAILHTQPPARYGNVELGSLGVLHDQPGGWRFLVLTMDIPHGFSESKAEVLIKLPPTFPIASPDMFWVHPALKLANGAVPQAASVHQALLGRTWQRFSWHLQAGAWVPGQSTIHDFIRCIRARMLRGN